jgi:hypothetical protein
MNSGRVLENGRALSCMNGDISIQRETELFDAASHLNDAASRRAFLAQACGENPALRERVEKLLAVQPDAEKFFQAIDPLQDQSGHHHETREGSVKKSGEE